MAKKKQNTIREDIIKATKEDLEDTDHPDDGGKLSPGPGAESFKLAQFWRDQTDHYAQKSRKWFKRGNSVIKRFRDERTRGDEDGARRFNALWTNFRVMKPAIYSKCPIPVVDRRFLDRDPIGRLSSQILERILVNEIEGNGYHEAISMAVNDRLLPGRGIVWVRYVPTIGQGVSIPAPTQNAVEDTLFKIGQDTGDKRLTEDSDKDIALDETGEQVLKETVEVDYIDWRDLLVFPSDARTWREVQAIGKWVHISKKEAIERFGKKIGGQLRPDTTPMDGSKTERETSDVDKFRDIHERNIAVCEIWNKSDRRVYWISTGYEYLVDVKDDPLELTGFFPVPSPLCATMTNDTLFPVPDYIEYQDQAIQMDELTQRLAMLAKACKVAGAYNSAHPAINRIFNESTENELVPIEDWVRFAEGGGLESNIDFIPIEQIQKCIETLSKVRQQTMIDLDQVTGISDVIRGTTDSRETLGGIRLKNNNAGTRLSESQEDVARFARDTIRIIAEVISKHFSEETIIESSGILYEDALQPDVVLREWYIENKSEEPEQPQANQFPQQDQQQPQQPVQQPGAMPGQPQPQMPQVQPQQQPNTNVVPFPGGQQQQPPQGQPPGQSQPQQMQAPLTPEPEPPDPEVLALEKVIKAIQLLKKDVTRGYRIDIETDSTIFGDKMQDRQDANEFLIALGGYMKQAAEAAAMPESIPVVAKALQWVVRKQRTGRDLEAEIDNFCEAMLKKSKEMIANPQPDPDQQKADVEVKKMQMQAQMEHANDMRAHQVQESNDQREAQMAEATNNREKEKMGMELQIEKERLNMEREKMTMEMEMMKMKHQLEMAKLQAQTQMDHHKMQMQGHMQKQELQNKSQMQQMDMHQEQQQHQQTMEQNTQQHQQTLQQGEQKNQLAKDQMQQKEQHMNKQHQMKTKETQMAHKQKMQQAKVKPAAKKAS